MIGGAPARFPTELVRLKKYGGRSRVMTVIGLILVAVAIGIAVLLFSLRYENLWRWYSVVLAELEKLEQYIASIPQVWLFVLSIIALFAVKSLFPIYMTSTVCFLTGIVLPMPAAIAVNVLGFAVLLTIKYFWGRRLGFGNAWAVVSKVDVMRKLLESDGRGNPWLLVILRLVPLSPINTISRIYGAYDFGYFTFLALSVVGFMPRLISFTLVGRNVFDPLSPSFLLPILLISLLSGISVLFLNAMWTGVEKIVRATKKKRREE